MFVVTVDFQIEPSRLEAFLELITANARASVRDEPHCRQFDVCLDGEDPARVFLYEVYDDRAAFDAHTSSLHYARFNEAAREMIRDKQIKLLRLASRG